MTAEDPVVRRFALNIAPLSVIPVAVFPVNVGRTSVFTVVNFRVPEPANHVNAFPA